jgi:hypothetical protein
MATLTALSDEVVSHQFAPSQYTTYAQGKINQGQEYICAQTDFRELASSETITLVAGQEAYDLPTDYQRNYTVLLTNTDGSKTALLSTEKQPFDPLAPSSGCPTRYSIQGSQIKFYPVPDTAGTVTLNYYAKPPTLGVNDSPVIPDQYEYLLVHYALKFCYERENDYNSAAYHWGQFQEGLMKCRGEVQHDTNDYSQPRVIGDDGTQAILVEGF